MPRKAQAKGTSAVVYLPFPHKKYKTLIVAKFKAAPV
jgi:hypothetical protein